MADTTGKRFSNIRYWRYVFTPILFVILLFGLFLLYAGGPASTANFSNLTGVLRRNTNAPSLDSVLAQIEKFRT